MSFLPGTVVQILHRSLKQEIANQGLSQHNLCPMVQKHAGDSAPTNPKALLASHMIYNC